MQGKSAGEQEGWREWCGTFILRESFLRLMPRVRFIFREWILRMDRREASLGFGNSILRSMRPGRSRAGSRMSIRLVAINTYEHQYNQQSMEE